MDALGWDGCIGKDIQNSRVIEETAGLCLLIEFNFIEVHFNRGVLRTLLIF